MYDLFFVSYEEPNADENWERLSSRFPHAKRIHGIKGIDNAHKACAARSFTKMFWTVDGDTVVDDGWEFDYQPTVWDQDYLHVWYSRNPVNGLSYGYGSIKLWPKGRVLQFQHPWLDFTGSVGGMKIMPETIAVTRFNTSPFETWKSAFRECVKLVENLRIDPNDVESRSRLDAWMTRTSDVDFSEWCQIGAADGVSWHVENEGDLSPINDFDWLKNRFHAMRTLIT
jgi:hypothetical protein